MIIWKTVNYRLMPPTIALISLSMYNYRPRIAHVITKRTCSTSFKVNYGPPHQIVV